MNITKTKLYIAIAIILIVSTASSFYMLRQVNIANAKTEIVANEAKQRIAEAEKPTNVELTKLMLDAAKSQDEEIYNHRKEKEEEALQAKRIYEAHIWFKECLTVTGELELRDKVIDFQCQEYGVFHGNYLVLVGDETVYKFLERFASYNIENTKKELGL